MKKPKPYQGIDKTDVKSPEEIGKFPSGEVGYSKYNDDVADKIFELFATGDLSVIDTCKAVGISTGTYYNWIRTKTEFRDGIAYAKKLRLEAFASMAKSGLAKLLDTHTVEEVATEYVEGEDGKPIVRSKKVTKKTFMPNAAAVIYTLKNRDSENWTDRQQIEHSGSVHTTGYEHLTTYELVEKKKELEDFLSSDADL